MPTYDYRCNHCGHAFELRQGFEADPVEVCPVCRKQARRLLHVPAIIYKGSGFYTTDYKNNHVSSPASAKNGASSSEPSKSEAPPKAESQSEAKSQPKEAKSGDATKEAAVKEPTSSKA